MDDPALAGQLHSIDVRLIGWLREQKDWKPDTKPTMTPDDNKTTRTRRKSGT